MPAPQLLERIQTRQQKQTQFGRGILTADKFVRGMENVLGVDGCYKYAADRHRSWDDLLRKASETLVYSNDDGLTTAAKEVDLTRLRAQVGDDIVIPKNTLMGFVHTITSTRVDRDEDVLESAGAQLDPAMLLLWQHCPSFPIGKMLQIVDQNEEFIKLCTVIVDMNELSHDAAVMVDNGMGRFSHGFRALDYEEREGGIGFLVKAYEMMEESLVSIPSNVDADVDEILVGLVEGGKLTSALMKDASREIRSRMPVQVPSSGIIVRSTVSSGEQMVESEFQCQNIADLKEAHAAGLIPLSTEDGNVATKNTASRGNASKETAAAGKKEEDGEGGGAPPAPAPAQDPEVKPDGAPLNATNRGKLEDSVDTLKEVYAMEDVKEDAEQLLGNALGALEAVVESITTEAAPEPEPPEEGKEEEPGEPGDERPTTLLPKSSVGKLKRIIELVKMVAKMEEVPDRPTTLLEGTAKRLKEVVDDIDTKPEPEEPAATPPPAEGAGEEGKSIKAGRALSKGTLEKITEAVEDLKEAVQAEELKRATKSLIKSAVKALEEVAEAAAPAADEEPPAEPPAEDPEKQFTADGAISFLVANGTSDDLRKAIDLFSTIKRVEARGHQARALRQAAAGK